MARIDAHRRHAKSRQAFDGDVVCVTPEQRDRVRRDNEQAPYLYAK
jgi:hypothetical protein